MKKKMAVTSRLGLSKRNLKRPTATSTTTTTATKRVAERRFCAVEELLNYLKSDSFLYSTLLIPSPSPSPSLPPTPPSEVSTPREEIAGKGLKEYMKSDSYLYAPVLDLGVVNHPSSPPTDTVEGSGNQVPLKTVISRHKTRGTPMAVAAANVYNLRRP